MIPLSDVTYDISGICSESIKEEQKTVNPTLTRQRIGKIYTVFCGKNKALEFRVYHGLGYSKSVLRIWPNVTAEVKRAKIKPLYYACSSSYTDCFGMCRDSVLLEQSLEKIGVIPSELIGGRGINHDQLRRLAATFNHDFIDCFADEIELNNGI